MAKKTKIKSGVWTEVKRHYDLASQELDNRRTGKNKVGTISFDEADELFRSWLDENNWPYDALLFDPRVFTFIIEKTSRLLANKLRGRLIPREGGDVLAAHINNELLNYQWDQDTHGGSMLAKWSLMDINTRKYGSAFSISKWRHEIDKNKRVVFDGPTMKTLNNRDCLFDIAATSIEDCNWFQVREYVTLQELKAVNDRARKKPIYHNLGDLEFKIGKENASLKGGDTRGINWISRNRAIAGLESDPIGRDEVFKRVEVVTEYRRDRWITFSPRHGVVLRDIDNPYGNNEIPIVMLRYYQVDDDLYGLSEIEPVKGLQKAINAILSQYVDEINQKLYSPIAIGPGVRQYTLEWGKGAKWLMQNPMTDFRLVESRSNAAQFFNNTYSALVAAMLNALGESSLGVSNIGRYNPEKTATEVKAVQLQRNARDNFNQSFLAEAIQRQMMLWHTMNQKMLFSDTERQQYIVRIVGKDAIKYFQERGLSETEIPDGALSLIEESPSIDIDSLKTPMFPVNTGTEEKPNIVSKLSLEEGGAEGALVVEPEDIKGNFDFIADVEAMSLNAGEEEKTGRATAVKTLLSSPSVIEMLRQEGVRPKFKDMYIAWLEDAGFKDAQKFFETLPPQQAAALPQGGQSTGRAMSGPAIPQGTTEGPEGTMSTQNLPLLGAT